MVRFLALRVRVPLVLRLGRRLDLLRAILSPLLSAGRREPPVAAGASSDRRRWSRNQLPVPASERATTVFCTLPRATAV